MDNCTITQSQSSYHTQIMTTSDTSPANTSFIMDNCHLSGVDCTFYNNVTLRNSNIVGSPTGSMTFTQYCSGIFNIENCTIQERTMILGGNIITVRNSILNLANVTQNYTLNSMYIIGSTFITSGNSGYDFTKNILNDNIFITDSAFIFGSPYSATSGFYNAYTSVKAKFDPVDNYSNKLYLNMVRIPGAANSLVNLSIDGRDTVNLLTDNAGYLHLYLPKGSHSVYVNDYNGFDYQIDFTGATARDTNSTSNIVGDMVSVVSPTTVTFPPYANTEIDYSMDGNTWNTITTNLNCQFNVVFPDGVKHIFLRIDGNLYEAAVIEGVLGSIDIAKPNILSQSNSEVQFITGSEAVLYMNAEPVFEDNDLDYQWSKNGEELAAADAAILSIPNVQESDTGVYTCEISESGVESTISEPIVLTLDKGTIDEDIKIIAQSSNRSLIIGYSTDLFAIGNSDNTSYQWYKDDAILDGETDSTIHITPTVTGSAIYTCILSKDGNTLESNPITVTTEVNPLSDDLADLNQIANDLRNQLYSLTEQLEITTNSKNTLQETVEDLEAQISILQESATDLNNQVNNLQQQLQEEQENSDILNQTILELQNQANDLNGQINTLQNALDTANQDKTILEITITDLNNNINGLNGQVSLLQGELSDSEEENTDLKNQISELNTLIISLQSNISNLNTQMADLTENNNTLTSQLNSANSTIQVLNNQITTLLQENASLQEQLDNAISLADTLQSQLTAEQTKSNNLQVSLNASLEELAEIALTLGTDAEQDRIINEILRLKNEVSNLGNQLQTSNDTVVSLNSQISNQINTIQTLQTKIDEAMNSLDIYEGEELQDKVQSVITENNNLNDQVTELTSQNDSLTKQIEQLNVIINNMLSQISDLEDENNTLTTQLSDAENTIDTLQSQLTTEINKSQELQQQISDLVSNISGLQQQLNHSNTDNESLQAEIDAMQSQIISLTQQLEDANPVIAELNNQISVLNEVIASLQQQIMNAMDSLDGYEGSSLIEKIHDILEKQTSIKNELKEAGNLNKDLEQQLSNATGQLNYLQSEIERLTGVLDDKDEEIERLNELLQQKNQQNAALSTENNSLTSENSSLTTEIISLQETLETLQKDTNVDELNQRISDLENEITRLNECINNTDPSNAEELKKLQNQLDDANETIEKLKNQTKSNSTSTDPTVKEGEFVVVPETSVSNNAKEIVKDSIIDSSNNKIETNSGWEVTSTLSSDATWSNSIVPVGEGYTGVYTFLDNNLNDQEERPRNDKLTSKGLAVTGLFVNGLNPNNLAKTDLTSNWLTTSGLSDKIGMISHQDTVNLSSGNSQCYSKYTFYARKVSEKNKIYLCSVDVEKTDYISPVTSLSSSVLDEPRAYTPENDYNTRIKGKVVFKVDGEFGPRGKDSVKYQVVPENRDFDADGTWTEIFGDSFTVPVQNENYRVYVKYTDKAGNFTVDKTVGFKVKDDKKPVTKDNQNKGISVPAFEINKSIELGFSYTLTLSNLSKNARTSYSSDNEKIATVSKDGVITSVAIGNANIYGTITDGDYTYQYIVKVSVVKGKYEDTLNLKAINSVSVNGDKPVLTIYKMCERGKNIKLNITGYEDAQITYISTEPEVATVSSLGVIYGRVKGKANIYTIVTVDGVTYMYLVVVRVDDGTLDNAKWDYLSQ